MSKVITIDRKKHEIDATGKTLGRLASEIAQLLRGKHKPSWDPSLDCGDSVEVLNVDKLKVTGNKMDGKIYYRHSGYPGGIKKRTLAERISKKGYAEVLHSTVRGMLPNNKLRKQMLKRLTFKSTQE